MDSTSKKKIARVLELMRSHNSNPVRVSELTREISSFLVFTLPKPMRVEDSDILFEFLENFIESAPLDFLIPISPYFSHGLNRHKPIILKFYKKFYFSNHRILSTAALPLVFSSLKAVSESNDISAQVTEMIDRASRTVNIHDRVWKIVLLSPKARLPALNYLMYRLVVDNKTKALHALVVSLQDPAIPIRKAALVLIKRIFSFVSPEVESSIKKYLLVQVFQVFRENDRNLIARAIEWVQDGSCLSQTGIEIVVSAFIEFSAKGKQDDLVSILKNFLAELMDYKEILKRILMTLSVNFLTQEGSLPDFLHNLILSNKDVFWDEYKRIFLQATKNNEVDTILVEIGEQLFLMSREQIVIEFMVLTLLQHIKQNPEKFLKFCIHLLDNIKKTDIHLYEVENFAYNSKVDWKLKVELLIKFHEISLNCEELINSIIEDNIETEEDKIKSIEFYLNCNPQKITKDDITFVFEFSIATHETALISAILKKIPNKTTKELKILVATESDFALECLLFLNSLGIRYKSGLLHEISKLFEDEDYFTRFLSIKWLTLTIHQKIDIFSELAKDLESGDRKSGKKYPKVLETLKKFIKSGGWPVIQLMIDQTQSRIPVKVEQLILKPPNNSLQIRILACELSSEIILNSNSLFSTSLVDAGLEVLLMAIDQQEVTLQLVMIGFFDSLLATLTLEAENEIKSKGLVYILDPLTKILMSSNLLVRNAWLDFVKRLVPFLLKYLDSSTSLNYINSILRTFFSLLSKSPDMRILISLQDLTRKLIDMTDSFDLSKTGKKLLYFFLQKFIDLTGSKNEEQIISKQILRDIFSSNPQKFIKKIISLWVEDCMYSTENLDILERYVEITQEFELDLFEIFKKVKTILCKNFEVNLENDQKVLTVSCALTKFQERLKTNNVRIWTEAIFVYERIISIKLPEICFLVSYSFVLLKEQVSWKSVTNEEQIALAGIVKTCMQTTLTSLNCSLNAFKLPYPLLKTNQRVQVSTLYLALINSHFHKIAQDSK